MDFRLSPEQQALAESLGRFCERDYGFEQRLGLIDTPDGFSREIWRHFADLGWLGAGLSEEAGGFGGGGVETMLILEAFGRALVLEPFVPSAILSLQTLAALPGEEERDALVADIVGGEKLVALAHGEAAARGDVEHVGTIAQDMAEGWRITGAKSLVFGAPSADTLLVSARSDRGVGLYRISPRAAGVTMRPYRTLDNMRVADIAFDDVAAEAQLSPPGEAMPAIRRGHDHALVAICAEAVGAMDAAILLTRDYLKTRQQFGAPLASFQALQHRMADMLVEMELSRSIVFQALAVLDAPEPERVRPIAAMKAIVSAAALFVGRNAVQLHGGIGMAEEHAIGHYYRRLFVIAGQFGNEAHHLERLAANPAPFWRALTEPCT
jgi:alkylation response protein AidB-like acyl-CoA dehydrogenase